MKIFSTFLHPETHHIALCPRWHFDPGNTGAITHHDRFATWCLGNLGAKYVCLDTEGVWFEALRQGGGIDEHLNLLYLVKSHLPHAQVGFYGLPLREYWRQGMGWIDLAHRVIPIVRASDVLFPSVYDFYNTNPKRDHDRARRYVALCAMYGKPMIPFTYHRFHISNPEGLANRLIDRGQHIDQMRAALSVGVDGLCAWSGDRYYWRKAMEESVTDFEAWRAVFKEELMPDETAEAYHGRIETRIVNNLRKAVA